jgi:hypothetical protein
MGAEGTVPIAPERTGVDMSANKQELFEMTVGIDSGDLQGNTNVVLQAAVDRAASMGGGVVNILPGVYTMNDSLHLRSGVTVRGCGEDTILMKPPSVKSKTIRYLGYGHYDVSVAEPEKFRIGMGVYITDRRSGGFYSTVATINSIKGDELGLTKPLNSDISEAANGVAISVYPIISGYNLKNASVEDLVIEGNADENDYINGCRGGGVFLLQAHYTTIRRVKVRNFNGDGISFQQCRYTVVDECACIRNKGHGLHPGSGSVGPIIRSTEIKGNGMDGIYYCLRVSYSLCENCLLEDNKRDGISIGHRDTDTLIRNNRIASNHRYGVYFRDHSMREIGDRNILENNDFYNNCNEKGQIGIDSPVSNVFIIGNTFRRESIKGQPCAAIYVNACSNGLVVSGNDTGEDQLFELADEKFMDSISLEEDMERPDIGPKALPDDGDSHLGVDFI